MINKPKPLDKETHVMSTKSIMCKTDINGIIEYANDYFVALSGYNEGELMGESLKIIKHPDTPNIINNEIWDKIKNKKNVNAILKYISKSGNFYWLQIKFDFKVDQLTRDISSVYLYATSAERMAIINLNKFYTKLNKIEKESSIKIAKKYFESYLENSKLSYESFIEKFLKK